jgi:hypothetical protein
MIFASVSKEHFLALEKCCFPNEIEDFYKANNAGRYHTGFWLP